MRKIPIFILFILFIPFNLLSQDYKQIADGIEYAEVVRGTEKEPLRFNLLKLDLTKVRLDVVHAFDAAIGLEKTSSIAARHGAIAAINAGFFKMDGLYKGDGAGLLKIDNVIYSESFGGRVALMIENKLTRTDVSIERVNVNYSVKINNKVYEITINRQRGENDLVLFKPEFHRTTLTDNSGVEFIVKRNRVTQIVDKKGSNPIPSNGYVISASGKRREEFLSLLKIGTKIELAVFNSSPDNPLPNAAFNRAEDVVGGVPQLIRDGLIEIKWEQEKSSKSFVETRHPRTAVAKLKDGKFLLVTVDGRQPTHSIGIGLQELAEFLFDLGATEAMNLDGGGSTAMFLDGKLMNKPSDKEGERSVSDAILVFPRKK
ncbi:MAG: phosphodiester glycosidase family protein [Acidobacteriota bacterium]